MPRGIPAAGKRAQGAGRPPLGPLRLQRVSVALRAEQIAWLRGLGWGTLSQTVRRLVQEASRGH